MKRRLVLEEWNTFRQLVIAPGASGAQLQTCKQAFYAGAHAVIQALMRNFDAPGEPTEDDLKLMEDVEEELKKFTNDVLAGRQ